MNTRKLAKVVTNLQSGGGLFAQRIVTRRHYDMARAKAIARHSAGLDAVD
jgi:4-hydroxybutyryl-CoA dehydratase/vinylacetyl-CoA-Delta-isomerase